ncbi:hypothetical protein RCH14_003032 [Massilia sp. MP_M2]|uniref:hypothetical protein n=1 Tax=Massilia sp. MP_M2 TaxID=3071713 RepID=UPI00319E30CE
MIDRLALEGIKVGRGDKVMLRAYIDESVTGLDLLAQAHQFGTMDEYHDWWLTHQEAILGTSDLNICVESILAEYEQFIRRKYKVLNGEQQFTQYWH